MLKTIEEIKNADLPTSGVINGVDNANLLSVDSTAPVTTEVDVVENDEKKEEVVAGEKPVEKEEAADDETPEKKDEPEKAVTPPEEKPPLKKDAVQKRIDELTRKYRTAERDSMLKDKKVKELEEELLKLKSTVPATVKPIRSSFEDEDAYLEALTDWKISERLRVQQEKTEQEVKSKSEVTENATINQSIDSMVESGREKYEDFEEIALDKDLRITPDMVGIIVESEISADIMYFLGKNPDKADEIAKMSPLKVAREIGKLEVQLVAEQGGAEKEEEVEEEEKEVTPPEKAAAKPVVKKVSHTPPPIKPPKALGVTEKDPSQMTPKEYRQWRESKKG